MNNEEQTQTSNASDTPWTSQIFDAAKPGAFVEKWHEKLPDELSDYRGIASDATSVKDLLHRLKTSVQAAREKAGLKPLPAGATEEQRAAWERDARNVLGVPADAKGYELKAPENGLPWDESEKGYVQTAHKLGLTKSQAAGLKEWYESRHNEGMEAQAATVREMSVRETGQLETTYGPRLGAAIELTQRAAHGEGWPAEVFDPRHERFIGYEAFKLVHALAGKLQKASASDPFPGAGTVRNDPAGLEYAKAVMSGKHTDSTAWRKGDRSIQERIDAAYERAFPGGEG